MKQCSTTLLPSLKPGAVDNINSLSSRWQLSSSSLCMPNCKLGMMRRKFMQCSNNKTLKRTELITIKLPLVLETCNWFNISYTNYHGISLWLNLGSWWQQHLRKACCLRYLIEAMFSDSFAFTKARSCRQHQLFEQTMTTFK